MAKLCLVLIPALCLAVALAACGSDGLPTSPNSGGGGPNASAGAPGTAGAAQAGSGVGGGGNPSAGAPGVAGAVGTAGAPGNQAGAGNTAGASGMTGAAGAGPVSMAGAGNYSGPIGQSSGCGKPPPANDAIGKFTKHEIHVQATLAANYMPGGDSYDKSGNYDFKFRPYSVRLPNGYDQSKKYSVVFGGGGCGGNATDASNNPGAGYDIDKAREAIFVGLPYVAGCFADGGGGTKNRADTPEVPFVHEVLAEVKANYCVDTSKVFITGHSSGGWESFTVGCALANEIRGIAPVSGGLRNHRPACTGPQASIMVEGLGDTANPIGPLNPPSGGLDSAGSAPARDEILKRNGCVAQDFQFVYDTANTKEAKAGNAPHDAWDPMYPSCYKYTGCPATYPVVWCALPGGHETDNEGNLDYKVGMMKFFSSLPSH